MADYKSQYSGEEIDNAVSRALTLTQLDGTVISDRNASYIVLATVSDDGYQYKPFLWKNLPIQSDETATNKLITINEYGTDGSNVMNYTINAGRVPFAETVSDDSTKRSNSVYSKIINLETLANATDTALTAHKQLNASASKTTTDDDNTFYHISGTLIKRWNDANTNLGEHTANSAIHLTTTQAEIINKAKTHYDDIINSSFTYHLKSGERATLNKWMGDSNSSDSILYLQTQLKSCLTASFQVSETAPTNKNILWIDSANKVLKYYSDESSAWVIVPVAYS